MQSMELQTSLLSNYMGEIFRIIPEFRILRLTWETDLNKLSRLLSESQFINSVIDCMYALVCTQS